MINNNDYSVGTIVQFKKPHPSHTTSWEVVRIGIDIKLKSQNVDKLYIIIPRIKFLKQVKTIIAK